MGITISDYASGEIIYTNSYPYNFEVPKDIDENNREIIGVDYQLQISEKWFEGIHITITEIMTDIARDFKYTSTYDNIGFLYCMEGELNFHSNKAAEDFYKLTSKQQHIAQGQLSNTIVSVDGKLKYLHIQLTPSYYQRIADTKFIQESFPKENIVEPEMELLLQSIINSKYVGRANRLFIESKIFELIIHYIDQRNKPANFLIKRDDVEKILLAKQMVEADIQKPKSLVELSRKVGINDYKLKKGFKEITGYTVFGYLYKIRMEQAYHYLSQEKKSVNEVSYLVGYKNPQHFIYAFKKLYKVLPGSLNKS
ncbi:MULTISPECIES: helix-turn-helix transcriptional regulator [Pedobacter]|uniref:helix-turn-helix transcriptional regulator n=1 Tax=Pedobacter TaxID=84567 RepID=UPI0012019BC4|nr:MULTISPECIES: AraC family transcriptional regulator [Pedobacter]RZL66772.1 MAG: AraC family transcriptional regulator [Pedobacter sp.]